LAARALAKQDPDYPYYRNIGLLIQLKSEKTSEKQIREILEKTADHETAQKIVSQWMDPDAVFGKLYPRFRCWDCLNCEANGICDYAKTQEVMKRLRTLYRENVPDQNQLLKAL
jgi:DNA-binding transcriptional MerR regulator